MSELTKTLVGCTLFVLIGLYLGWCYPTDYLRLYASADGSDSVDGVIQRRLIGIVPIEQIAVSGVNRSFLRESPEDVSQMNPSTIVLDTLKGHIVYTHLAWLRGEQEVMRINRYVDDPGEHHFVTWRANWPFFLVSAFLVVAPLVYGLLQFWQSLQAFVP